MPQTLSGQDQSFRVLIGETIYDITLRNGRVFVNDEPVTVNFEHARGHSYSLILDGKSIPLVVTREGSDGAFRVTVANRTVVALVKDDIALLRERFGLGDNAKDASNDLRAPMPGLVLDVRVAPGSEVEAGEGLVVLEAMKMENELCAPQSGTIEAVHVQCGDAVVKNALLVEFAA